MPLVLNHTSVNATNANIRSYACSRNTKVTKPSTVGKKTNSMKMMSPDVRVIIIIIILDY